MCFVGRQDKIKHCTLLKGTAAKAYEKITSLLLTQSIYKKEKQTVTGVDGTVFYHYIKIQINNPIVLDDLSRKIRPKLSDVIEVSITDTSGTKIVSKLQVYGKFVIQLEHRPPKKTLQ